MSNFRHAVLSTIGACGLLLGGMSQADIRLLEQMIETSSDVVPLPSSIPSTFVVKLCPQCTSVTLRADESTRFFAGDVALPLNELRRVCGGGKVGVTLGYHPTTRVVTRVLTTCEAPRPANGAGSRRNRAS